MQIFPPTVVIRHRKENLKKCSLRGLESREDFHFLSYPFRKLPDLSGYVMLALDAPPLTKEDADSGLLLLDATWRYAEKMEEQVNAQVTLPKRSIPQHYLTAYPRIPNPERGLASVEALYIAYYLLGRDVSGLLDQYHWKEPFIETNFSRTCP